jgi:hypothetical protein
MQHLDLSDDETAALTKELDRITRNDRYPFSERIRTLNAILAKLSPEPVRGPCCRPRCMLGRERKGATGQRSWKPDHNRGS